MQHYANTYTTYSININTVQIKNEIKTTCPSRSTWHSYSNTPTQKNNKKQNKTKKQLKNPSNLILCGKNECVYEHFSDSDTTRGSTVRFYSCNKTLVIKMLWKYWNKRCIVSTQLLQIFDQTFMFYGNKDTYLREHMHLSKTHLSILEEKNNLLRIFSFF